LSATNSRPSGANSIAVGKSKESANLESTKDSGIAKAGRSKCSDERPAIDQTENIIINIETRIKVNLL
jgi:hypothetical protein